LASLICCSGNLPSKQWLPPQACRLWERRAVPKVAQASCRVGFFLVLAERAGLAAACVIGAQCRPLY
jgi:hypothetical protein